MSEAAPEAVSETTSEAVESDYIPGISEDPELPDFNLFGDDIEEPAVVEEKKEEPQKKQDTWSSKVKKDRQQRKKEIELKRREQEIASKEVVASSSDELRDKFLKNPEEFLTSQGIDPMEFFSDWTNRISTGINAPSDETRLSQTEQQVKQLREELQKRDRELVENATAKQQEEAIKEYYSKVDDFMRSTEDYPLTKEQCSAEDIAQGIAAYHQKTGIELSFPEAAKMIEDGLVEKENTIFNDPSIIAKFKRYHGLDASNKGRRSQVTLSNTLQTQPTKTPAEDMSDDEIHEFWKGKLFT
tara:strand:- start:31 stop:930 length:900 start_codon:yes stop_codon:yes gene_type:complete